MKKNLVFLLVVFLFIGVGYVSSVFAADASLSLSPKTQTVEVGNNLVVNLNLDTDDAAVSSVDAVLDYPVDELEYVKTTATTNFPNVTATDSPKGRLHLHLTTSSGTFIGVDKIATITFKALKSGQAPVTFVFTQGASDDSNVMYNSEDILTTVSGGTYTIVSSSSSLGDTSTSTSSATPTLPVTGPTSLVGTTLVWSVLLIGLGVLVFFGLA